MEHLMHFRRGMTRMMQRLVCSLGLVVSMNVAAEAVTLNEVERSELRDKLESLFNEADLLIRNQNAHASDRRRQKLEVESLNIHERVPFKKDIPGLKKQLGESAEKAGLRLSDFRLEKPVKEPAPVVKRIHTDQRDFRLKPEQVVERIPFRMTVQGPKEKVEKWLGDINQLQFRMIEPQGELEKVPAKFTIRKGSKPSHWTIQAQAYRYRQIEFPKLVPRDPIEYLPTWARKDPTAFAKAEPLLWSFVTRFRELRPKALPLYEERRAYMLNRERLEFFFSRAIRHSRSH